jgi:Secretion system C-terminal sorting domain
MVSGSFNGPVDWALVALEIKPQITISKHAEIAASEIAAPPSDFQLEQNYPNPFNPDTRIRFGLPQASHVSIKIYSIAGAEVSTVVDNDYPAGTHAIIFQAKNLSSGVYFYVMQAGEARIVRRLMLVK